MPVHLFLLLLVCSYVSYFHFHSVAPGTPRTAAQDAGDDEETRGICSASASPGPVLIASFVGDGLKDDKRCPEGDAVQKTGRGALKAGRRGVKGQEAAMDESNVEPRKPVGAGEAGVLHRLRALHGVWKSVVLHFVVRREELSGGDLHFLATALTKFKRTYTTD